MKIINLYRRKLQDPINKSNNLVKSSSLYSIMKVACYEILAKNL